MLIIGLICLVLGIVLSAPILWTIGIILVIVGAILMLAQSSGASWGRRWY